MDYNEIFQKLKHQLTTFSKTSIKTPDFTREIVTFFKNEYKSYLVLSHDEFCEESREYLYDICVMKFDPLEIYKNDKESYKIDLVVESELGGESASSANSVERNVIEDFFKILQANAEKKILIGIYSSKRSETDALNNRIKNMFEIAKKTDNQSPILIVLIEGEHPKGGSQVKIKNPLKINGFIITPQSFNSITEANQE